MLEEIARMNKETVRTILVKDLKKKEMPALFVPHLLTPHVHFLAVPLTLL
jgi:hypothetical protein